MGTPLFALPTLQALVASHHDVVAVYSQPPRPAGRGQKERLSPVHEFALSQNIAVFTPTSLKTAEAQAEFKALGADAAVVAAYGLLLPPAILQGTRMGCINVHPSLLPRWRGAAPIQRTVMAGDKKTGVAIMQMNEGLDTGDVLLLEHFTIAPNTTAGALHDMLAAIAGPLILKTLDGLQHKTITPLKQSDDGVTYAKKITKEECRIDWKEPAVDLQHKILGLSPAPGAYFIFNNESIKILAADVVPINGAPGTVMDDMLTIACGSNALRPTLLQRPGKKPMAAQEMLRGYAIPPATVME